MRVTDRRDNTFDSCFLLDVSAHSAACFIKYPRVFLWFFRAVLFVLNANETDNNNNLVARFHFRLTDRPIEFNYVIGLIVPFRSKLLDVRLSWS